MSALVVAACSSTSAIDGFDTVEVIVDGTQLTVAEADSSTERSQGLQDLEELPAGIDGMLFVFDGPTSTTFHMRNVRFPLDVWLFDEGGRLTGSARMDTCTEGSCGTYSTPGPVAWALETAADKFVFAPGSELSTRE